MKRGKISFKWQLLAVVLGIALPLGALLIVSTFYSIGIYNEKLAESNERTVSTCVGEIQRGLSAVDETLTAVVAGNSDFTTLSGGLPQLQAHLASLNLFTQLKTVMPSYPSIGAFFIYSHQSRVERDMFTSEFSYEEKEEIRGFVRDTVSKNSVTYKDGWRWAQIGEQVYLFRFFGGRSTYIVAMAPLEKLLEGTEFQMEQEAVVAFSTRDNQPLTQRDFLETSGIELRGDYDSYFLSGSPDRYMVIGRAIQNTDCRLVFLVGGAGFLDSLNPVQIALLLLSLAAVILIPLLVIWVNRSLIAPVEELKQTMERIQGGDLEAQAAALGNVPEFRQMNQTFNTMMKQIRELKIEAYEREIQTQKAELRYLQLQIRPHFFLNCLKSLYALAEQKNYEKIQRMILAFSRHIRYIFRDNMELVPLGRELEHVKNYIEIQGISAVHPPLCEIDVDDRLYDLPIPPLSLQTFVENSVKHETSPDRALEIKIKAGLLSGEEGTYIDLTVSDNGSGFPEEMLRELNDLDRPVYAEHHVGLNNVKKRMSLIYGENVLFAFFNSGSGSVSEILIPVENAEEVME